MKKTDCGPAMLIPSRACFKIKRRFKKIVLISGELPLCGQLSLSGYFQVPQGWQLRVCVCVFFLGGGRGVQLYLAIIVNYLRITHPTPCHPFKAVMGTKTHMVKGKKSQM